MMEFALHCDKRTMMTQSYCHITEMAWIGEGTRGGTVQTQKAVAGKPYFCCIIRGMIRYAKQHMNQLGNLVENLINM